MYLSVYGYFKVILTGPLPNAHNYFIVTDGRLHNIYQVDATSGTTAQLLPFGTASYPFALAYDSTAKLLYWTDTEAHTINRYSLLTNISTVIYRDPANAGKCEGLSIKFVSCECLRRIFELSRFAVSSGLEFI